MTKRRHIVRSTIIRHHSTRSGSSLKRLTRALQNAVQLPLQTHNEKNDAEATLCWPHYHPRSGPQRQRLTCEIFRETRAVTTVSPSESPERLRPSQLRAKNKQTNDAETTLCSPHHHDPPLDAQQQHGSKDTFCETRAIGFTKCRPSRHWWNVTAMPGRRHVRPAASASSTAMTTLRARRR